MTPKDKKIIEDSERDGIPIFVLTAKDKASLNTITFYENECRKLKCEGKHINGIILRENEFEDWQSEHPFQVKLPD
jgi:hypothetical protein